MKDEIAEINTSITKLEGFTTIEDMKKWAVTVIDSGLLPHTITEPEQVITIVQHGKELGLTPHISLNNINVISGKPTLSSTILGSLLKRRKIEWVWDEDFVTIKDNNDEEERASNGALNRRTTIHFYWKSSITNRVMEAKFSVTWAQFVLSGLVTRDNWKKMPKEISIK